MTLTPVPATISSAMTHVAAPAPADRNASDAGAKLAHVSNRQNVSEAGGGIRERIRSGIQHVFLGVRNLFAAIAHLQAHPAPANGTGTTGAAAGDSGDIGFLADPKVQSDFLAYLENVREAVVVFAVETGNIDLARQMDALYRRETSV